MSLCVAAAGVVKSLAVTAFMLSWTNSAEQVERQEDWRVMPQGLEIIAARVKGASAGMQPPPGARLADGWFRWTPPSQPVPEVALRQFGAAGEWRLCSGSACQDMSAILGRPAGAGVTRMSVCALDAEPTALDATTLLARGDDFSVKGELDRAIVNYDAALKADPVSAEAFNGRGAARRAKGDRRRALADFDAALKLKPDFAAARANRTSLFGEIERAGAQMPLKK